MAKKKVCIRILINTYDISARDPLGVSVQQPSLSWSCCGNTVFDALAHVRTRLCVCARVHWRRHVWNQRGTTTEQLPKMTAKEGNKD